MLIVASACPKSMVTWPVAVVVVAAIAGGAVVIWSIFR